MTTDGGLPTPAGRDGRRTPGAPGKAPAAPDDAGEQPGPAEQALRERAERQRFLLSLSDAIRPLGDPAEIQRVASRVLGEHPEVTRVADGEVDPDDIHITFIHDHVRDGAPSIAGRYRMADFGPALLARLRAGETIMEPELARSGRLSADERAARDVKEESERLVRIVDDLLVLSGVERGLLRIAPEPILVQHVLASVLADIRHRVPRAELVLGAPPGLPPVMADGTAIRQVLHNLVANAVKYAGSAGPVEIQVATDQAAVEVRVADHGPGLGPDPAALFTLFYRAPHTARLASGTGIGLYVARELVTAMGGTLTGTDRPGGGAEFRLVLPRAPDED